MQWQHLEYNVSDSNGCKIVDEPERNAAINTRIAGSSLAQVFFVSGKEQGKPAAAYNTQQNAYVCESRHSGTYTGVSQAIYWDDKETHTRLGARHRYVSCHAANSKSYDKHQSVFRAHIIESPVYHLLKPV
jgi:hypothetical protein